MTSKQGLHRMNKLHRTRENHLTDVVRVLDENIPKYRQVNYESMREIINERKVVGSQALERVSKLQQESHQMREQAELKVLRECWFNEQQKLNHQSKKIDEEHRNWLTEAFHDTDLLTLFHDITRYRIWLDEKAIEFRKTTVLPMMHLKEELQSNNIPPESIPNVLDALQLVKKEQQQLIEILDDEQRQIEEELKQFQQQFDEEDELNGIQEGIPEVMIHLACPDEELRATMLQEFLIIDHKYRESLVDLDAHYLTVVEIENGGWNVDEHEMLVHLYEMYPVDLKKRRTCIYDHFHRYFPSRSRQEMLNHEEWCNARNYYLKHKRMILCEWKQARAALEVKTQSVFAQAFELQEKLAQQKEEKNKQRALCEQLAQQVVKWREKQLEVLEVRRRLEESRRQGELEKLREENERFQKHRQQNKEKLSAYHNQKEEERHLEHEKEEKRLEEMQMHLSEQKRKDWERIQFRQEEYHRKRDEFHQRTEALEQEQLQREERLQALADRVKPHHVDIDHARVLQPTKAFNAHRGLLTNTNDEVNIQQSLFPINTFTDRKLYGDIRIRLEQRLRDAGLIQTDYARQALAALQQAPKRIDTQQNQMWSGFAFKQIETDTRNLSKPVKRDFISHPVFYGSDN